MQTKNLVLITNDKKNKRLIYYEQENQKKYKISHNNSVSTITLLLGPAFIPLFRIIILLIGTVAPGNSVFINFCIVIFFIFLMYYLSHEIFSGDMKKNSEFFTEISLDECQESILRKGIREINSIVTILIPLCILGIFMSGIFVILNIHSILSYILFGSCFVLGYIVSTINPIGLQKVTENFEEVLRGE